MNFLRRNRKPVVAVSITLMLMLMLLLITANWQPIATWRAPAAPPPKIKLRIAINNNYIGAALLHVAAHQGYFALEGLDVTFQPYGSGRDALAAALNKQADIATCANIPVLFAALDDVPVAIVATIFTANRINGIVARRDRDIAGITDLKGKTIGFALGTDSHYVLSVMLARRQIALADVRAVDMKPDAMLNNLVSGKVDAISTWEPGLSLAAKALGSNAVVLRTEGRFLFDFNLAGHADVIRAHPEQMQRLLRVLLRAKDYADRHTGQSRSIIAAAINADISLFDNPDLDIRFVVELNQNLLSLLEDQTRWAMQAELTGRTQLPNFLRFINMDPLTAVKPDAITIVR